jgi:uncharacterized HAD superfamily protein
MKIALDIDDVLADCNAGINAFLSEEKGIFLQREDWHFFNLEENIGHTLEEAKALYAEFHYSKYLHELTLIDGAQEAIQELAQDHTLIAVTSRGDDLDEATQKVIQQFAGHISELFYTNQYHRSNLDRKEKVSKGEICKREKVDLIIEDGLPNMETCLAHGIPVLLFDAPWNQLEQLPAGVYRVHSWKEALEYIRTIRIPSLPN